MEKKRETWIQNEKSHKESLKEYYKKPEYENPLFNVIL